MVIVTGDKLVLIKMLNVEMSSVNVKKDTMPFMHIAVSIINNGSIIHIGSLELTKYLGYLFLNVAKIFALWE